MITLDDTDQTFVENILIKAKASFDMRMTDEYVCEANRRRARELSKMTSEALKILNGLKGGNEK